MPLMPFDDALASVLASAPSEIKKENVPLVQCLGRYLAEDIGAKVAVPSFDNSAMDGYAVIAADVELGKPLTISQRVPAGVDPQPFTSGTAARIFTGAKVPEGADAVILQEDSRVDADELVSFSELPVAWQHIRLSGQDVELGTVVARAGERVSAADVGMIASVGVAEVPCVRPIRVAFFSTGDELQLPGKPLAGAQIYNSNRYMLSACLTEIGMEPIDLGVCEDSKEGTRAMLLAASEQADVILTTGGMSVGEEDYVRSEAEALGDLDFWKIAMKPGKPFAMGQINGAQFFGLPGNPVSTFVTFQLLVKPWLLKASGAQYQPKKAVAIADFDFKNKGKRLDFVRVKTKVSEEGVLHAGLFDNQSSGVLSSIAMCDALVPMLPGVCVEFADSVQLWYL